MNKSTTKAIWVAAGIAFGLHALLFVGWFNDNQLTQGNAFVDASPRTHSINIQLVAQVDTPPADSATSSNKQPIASPETIPSNTATTKSALNKTTSPGKQLTQLSESTASSSQPSLSAKTHKTDFDALNKLLYTAINQHKQYPLAALRLQQQGTVRVAFQLFNNGHIENIQVSTSSGVNALDKAALLAVKQIQPFQPAAEFIARAKGFQVDIIFQL